MTLAEPDPDTPVPGVIRTPESRIRRGTRALRRTAWQYRAETLPLYIAIPAGAAVEIHAATDPAWTTPLFYSVSGLALGGVSYVLRDHKAAAFGLGSAAGACEWACAVTAGAPTVPGLIVGAAGALGATAQYWRLIAKERAARRDVADVHAHQLEVERVRSERRTVPGQRSSTPELEAAPEREPLASVVWPGPPANPSITRPFALSDATRVLLPGGHILIVGETQSGKSSLEHVIVCNAIACPDAQVIGIDMKPGRLELGAYRAAGARIAQSVAEATELLEWVIAEGERRGEILGVSFEATGEIHTQWTPTPEDPHLVVVLDEVAELVRRAPKLAKKLETIASVLTALGITLVVCTQTPSASVWGGRTDTRAQFDTRIGLRTAEQGHTRIGLGDDAIRAGFLAHDLQDQGEFYIRSRRHRRPDIDRSYWISNEARADHIRAHAREAPPLPKQAKQDPFSSSPALQEDKLRKRIYAYVRAFGPVAPVQVAEAVGAQKNSVRSQLSKMARAKVLDRDEKTGLYSAPEGAPPAAPGAESLRVVRGGRAGQG